MPLSRWTAAMAVLICAFPTIAAEAKRELTFDEALALAREHSPALISARLRIDEAKGRLRDASVLLRNNPTLEGEAGPRRTPGEDDTTDLRFGLSQTIGLGRSRAARIAGATADQTRTTAESEVTTLEVLREVAVAFYRGLYAQERLHLALRAESLLVDIDRITGRRFETGDAARLDVNVAHTALSRARAEVHRTRTIHSEAIGDLRRLLGLRADEDISVRGALAERSELDLRELLDRASERPDLRALTAEIEQADAEARLAAAQRWPELNLGVAWEREEASETSLGQVALTVPIFDHGQGLRDESRARARRLRAEYEALTRAIEIEVETAFSNHRATVAAVEELEQNALPLLDENETLTRRAYEAGKLGLTELLLLRYEFLGTRLEYLERLLDAAVAGIELQATAGALR